MLNGQLTTSAPENALVHLTRVEIIPPPVGGRVIVSIRDVNVSVISSTVRMPAFRNPSTKAPMQMRIKDASEEVFVSPISRLNPHEFAENTIALFRILTTNHKSPRQGMANVRVHIHDLGVTTRAVTATTVVSNHIIQSLPSTHHTVRMLGATKHVKTSVIGNLSVLRKTALSATTSIHDPQHAIPVGRPSTHLTRKTLGVPTNVKTFKRLVTSAAIDPTVILHIYAKPVSGFGISPLRMTILRLFFIMFIDIATKNPMAHNLGMFDAKAHAPSFGHNSTPAKNKAIWLMTMVTMAADPVPKLGETKRTSKNMSTKHNRVGDKTVIWTVSANHYTVMVTEDKIADSRTQSRTAASTPHTPSVAHVETRASVLTLKGVPADQPHPCAPQYIVRKEGNAPSFPGVSR